MNRILKADRLYSLGDYRNLHLYDEINIPDEWDKPEIVNLIRWLQMLSIEKTYHRYITLYEQHITNMSHEDADKYILNLITESTKELDSLIKNGKLEA